MDNIIFTDEVTEKPIIDWSAQQNWGYLEVLSNDWGKVRKSLDYFRQYKKIPEQNSQVSV